MNASFRHEAKFFLIFVAHSVKSLIHANKCTNTVSSPLLLRPAPLPWLLQRAPCCSAPWLWTRTPWLWQRTRLLSVASVAGGACQLSAWTPRLQGMWVVRLRGTGSRGGSRPTSQAARLTIWLVKSPAVVRVVPQPQDRARDCSQALHPL